jgi:hypothetical protein
LKDGEIKPELIRHKMGGIIQGQRRMSTVEFPDA